MTADSGAQHDLVIEKDVEIPLRDGVRLCADVFRPKGAGKVPALINIGAYQKDKVWVPPADLEEPANPYMNWETVNPLWWVPRGYAAVRVDAGTHYHPFYAEEARNDQLRFLDHWLKGKDTGIMDEPPVKLLIRTGGGKGYTWRKENKWPLARTNWTRFYLAPASKGARTEIEGTLDSSGPGKSSSIEYSASGVSKAGVASASWTSTVLAGSLPRLGLSFETEPLREAIEITGPLVLNLWVSSTTEDMDVFATIRNIDANGQDVWEVGQQQQPVPVAKGWLRASHRKLDPALTLPYRPYHAHDERQWLEPGEKVEINIEIWPTCMVFAKGHRIRLDIQPRDGVGSAPYTHYSADYNTGQNTIYTGGMTPSHLLLPVIPRT